MLRMVVMVESRRNLHSMSKIKLHLSWPPAISDGTLFRKPISRAGIHVVRIDVVKFYATRINMISIDRVRMEKGLRTRANVRWFRNRKYVPLMDRIDK